ncbi:MAG: transglycosylase SLT domain-containing protein [Candidatus Krumholzibacteria bacterium]|nr:transglycosylase SLT domain-containing protein [Candidatus Krumholzibacteria bacterium]
MEKTHFHLPPDSGRTAKAVLFIAMVCSVVAGCQERIDRPGPGLDTNLPLTPHPVVERDIAAIDNSGVIRLITNYNSSSYFIHRGGQAGFDYELVWRFARERGLTVEVVIPEPDEDFVTLLNSGRGDLVGAGLVPDTDLERWVTWTRPTNFVRKVVVLSADSDRSADYRSLAGIKITLPAGDPFREKLQDLKKAMNIQFFVTTGKPGDQAEDLLTLVSQGRIEAAAVNDNIARSALAYLPNLKLGVHLGKRRPTGWLVRNNSPELKAALNSFLKDHLKVNPTGRTRRSNMYGTIYDRYFENPLSIQRFQEPTHRPDKSGILSTYDELIRRKAEAMGLDWRMVTALIYQESEFHPEAHSKANARGLMQVLPRFAGDQADSLFLPGPNLTAGLRMMKRTYNTYAYLDSLDRWRFTLAEYHAGHGHVTDARRMAIEMGRDPNKWDGSLNITLPRLMERKYFSKTRHGFYGGATTVEYVEEIINRYRMYTRLVARIPEPRIDQFPVGLPGTNNMDITAMPDLTRPPALK